MTRLVCRITGDVVTVPKSWVAWTVGQLHFKRLSVGNRCRIIQWRARGESRWHALNLEPAIERCRVRADREPRLQPAWAPPYARQWSTRPPTNEARRASL